MPGGPLFIADSSLVRLMLPWSLPTNWSDLTPADLNCTYGIQWIYDFMGQCVMDVRGMIAMVCGFVCLFAWILNGIPQMIENFRSGIPDKALSPLLLLFWTLGDMLNFVGCILAHQLILQVVVAVYSIASDLVLVSQFVYYKTRRRRVMIAASNALGDGRVSDSDDGNFTSNSDHDTQPLLHRPDAGSVFENTPLFTVCFASTLGLTLCTAYTVLWGSGTLGHSSRKSGASSVGYHQTVRRLPQVTHSDSYTDLGTSPLDYPTFLPTTGAKIGFFFGCISGMMYLSSRFPQIIRNYQRSSTEGLCLGLFCMAVLGNTSYGLQIFLTSLYPTYLLESLPWLAGSLGVLGLDFIICFQFYYYSHRSDKTVQTAVGDARDAPHSSFCPCAPDLSSPTNRVTEAPV